MKIIAKVREQGNSYVVTIPKALIHAGIIIKNKYYELEIRQNEIL